MLALYGIVMTLDTMSAGFLLTTIPFLIPIPFIFYTREYGFKAGLTVAFSALILGILLAPIHQVILAIVYVLIGVVYGWGVRKDFNDKVLIFITFGFVLIITLITVILLGQLFGYNILSEMKLITELAKEILGESSSQITPSLFSFIFMISLVLQSMLEAYVIHMLSLILFLYLKKKPVRRVKLVNIKYPQILGLISAGLFLLMLYFNYQPLNPEVQLAITFIGSVGYAYLAYLGLLFFYKDKRFNKWSIYSIILFIFTLSFYTPVHLVIGLFTSLSGVWRKTDE